MISNFFKLFLSILMKIIIFIISQVIQSLETHGAGCLFHC